MGGSPSTEGVSVERAWGGGGVLMGTSQEGGRRVRSGQGWCGAGRVFGRGGDSAVLDKVEDR
ncbi:hypothetical protein GCM10009837_00290 [Streptomyces durmitorensis]